MITLKNGKCPFSEMLNPLSLCEYFTVNVVEGYISLARWKGT